MLPPINNFLGNQYANWPYIGLHQSLSSSFSLWSFLLGRSDHFLFQWNWWLLFSLEQFQTPFLPDCHSPESYSLLLALFVSLVSLSCSFFSSRPGETTFNLQFENYCTCSSSWQLISAGLPHFLGATALTQRPISLANIYPCRSSYLDLLFVCFQVGRLKDGLQISLERTTQVPTEIRHHW